MSRIFNGVRQRSLLPLSCGLLLLVCWQVTAEAQTASESQTCQGSTVDTQGAETAKKAREFLAELQSAVGTGDSAKVAGMVSYPLLLIQDTHKTRIKDKTEFMAQYNTIFDRLVRKAVAVQSAKCLFGNDRGVMIGDGQVWFSEQQDGAMKIITVNPTAGPR